ncbi:MAG: S41 family peptidase, partial [Bacteroidota bacterium]
MTPIKFRKPLFFSVVLLAVVAAAAYLPKADSAQKDAILMRTIVQFMSQLHYEPQNINDDFSEKFFDDYLESIDGLKRYLTESDVETLSAYKYELDDQVRNMDYTFFDESLEVLDAALKKTQGMYREVLAQPFDFIINEEIEFDPDKRKYSKNDKELKDLWRRTLKYETMVRLNRKLKAQEEEDQGEEKEVKTFDELEQESREDVLKVFDSVYGTMFKLKRENRRTVYFNSFLHLYDPHSDYFEPVQAQTFDMEMTGRLEGIGATLQNDGDYTKVVDIVPGGPAWKGKQLEKGDLITKVAQGDDGEPEDIMGMLVSEVVQKIRGKKGTKVRLTVKKKDGTIKEIPIVRDIIIFEEAYAKSVIMDGATEDEKVGYINLPKFYRDFQNRENRYSTEDVAKELEKLKAENVNGIILDLRNNGGGALQDAVDLTG